MSGQILTNVRIWAQGVLTPRDLWIDGAVLRFAGPVDWPVTDCAGRIALPCFTDCHTHLDKGHIWPRQPNPDGRFDSALDAVGADRRARWTQTDIIARADFALRCAYAHGTSAMRSHVDQIDPRDAASWEAALALRERWRGRIDLQLAALTTIDMVDRPDYPALADRMAASGGVLGAVAFACDGRDAKLDRLFTLAAERGLALDFHADETLDPESDALAAIARAKLRGRHDMAVLVGHGCALSAKPRDRMLREADLAGQAGLDIVALPICNRYLMGRRMGETPRLRGIAPAHELRAAGCHVAFASDNTRDPFCAFGDLDMMEVMREAVRMAHLDHPLGDWPDACAALPAAMIGAPDPSLRDGGPADLILTEARSFSELFARPQARRVVIRAGCEIDTRPPDYAELDAVVGAPA